MTILHLITGLGSGGAEAMLTKLVTSRSRHRHIVASLGGLGTMGPIMVEAGVDVRALQLSPGGAAVSGIARLMRLIRHERPDVIQGWMTHGNLAATFVQPWSGRRPLVWNVRQTLSAAHCDTWRTRKLIRLNARLSRRPEVIIYNSSAGAEQHEAIGYALSRRRIIPNGFDLGVFSPLSDARQKVRAALGVQRGELLVGLIARFDPWKNHGAFMEAVSEIAKAGHAIRLLFAGTGMVPDNKQLIAMLADRALMERSLLLGDRRDIASLTAALDIACNVSLGEGFPNCVGEAMSCSVPCVVTPVGDNASIVGRTGVVCEGTSADAIRAGLLRLIQTSPEDRQLMGRRARARIAEHYSLPAIIAQYDQLYDDLALYGKAVAA